MLSMSDADPTWPLITATASAIFVLTKRGDSISSYANKSELCHIKKNDYGNFERFTKPL